MAAPQPAPIVRADAPAPTAGRALVPVAATESIGQPAPSRRIAISAALTQEFAATPDLHAFALRARQRPAEGGLFYAMAAANWCGLAQPQARSLLDEGVAAEIATTGTVTSRHLDVIERTLRRCAGFVAGETETLYRSVAAESANRSDPLLNTMIDLRAAKKGRDVDAVIAAAQRMLDTHDPLFVSANAIWLGSLERVGNQPPVKGLWFDGFDYRPSPDDASVYNIALQLTGCIPGQPCDRDQYLRMSCLTPSGFCPDTPADLYFRHPDAASRPAGFDDRVARLTEGMNRAIEAGNVRAFLAPKR